MTQKYKRLRIRRMPRIALFFLCLLFVAVFALLFSLKDIFGNLEPETLERKTLVRVMQLRDFRRFSDELTERFADRAEQEFGRQAAHKPAFVFPPLEKRIHIYFQERQSERTSYLDNNLMMMARIRYFQWMHEHQSGTLVQRAVLLQNVAADMRYWRELYFDYLRALGQPELTWEELYRDFLRMIDDFKKGASPEEIVLIDSFAFSLSKALFVMEIYENIKDWCLRF